MIDKLDGQIFANKSVDLLLEKPFGRNLLEAKNIIELIERVSKKVKVSFIDHYLFKNQAQIVDQAQIAKLFNTNLIEPSIINIVTLETVDVDNRLGYYIDSGAIDDMTPHLLSLLLKFLKLFEIDDFEININEVAIGQYEGLIDKIKEIDETKLNLETFFEVKADLINGSKLIDLKLASGKKLLKKKTELEAFLSNNGQFVWDISGNDQIIYTKDGNSTIINTEQNEKLDHVNMFLQVMKKDYSNFITNKQVIIGHNLITKIKEFVEFNNIKVEIY
jgi:glucose-6-phosphate 1-dehydrogenase